MIRSKDEIGRSYDPDSGMLDITGADDVQIQTDKSVIWVNVDGICILRICRIQGKIEIEDQFNETKTIV